MIKHIGFALGFTVLLAACGSDSSRRTPQQSPPLSVNGAAIKGPLVNANVSAYQIDPAAADLKGALLGDGETDASAQIVGLEIDSSTTGYILLEFTADADTVDLTTGAAPVLDSLVTFASMDRISADESIYATALTTLAMEIAASNAGNGGVFGGDDDGTATEAEFLSAVAVAENRRLVRSCS